MDVEDQNNETNISGKDITENNTETYTLRTKSRDTSKDWTFTPQSNHMAIDKVQALNKELLLLRELLIRQEDTYRDDLKRHKKIFTALQRTLQQNNDQEMVLMKQMTDFNADSRKFQIVLEEYKRAVTKLLAENDKARTEHEDKKTKILKDIRTVKDHLINTEKAFQDLQLKSNSMKRMMHTVSQNVIELNEKFNDNKLMIQEVSENYNALKMDAESSLESANEELAAMRRNHQNESSRLNAVIKKSELRIRSLEEVLAQKTKENQALMTMCDDLINNEDNDTEQCKRYELSETFTKNI